MRAQPQADRPERDVPTDETPAVPPGRKPAFVSYARRDLVGRTAELHAVLRDLHHGVGGVVLHGMGGIGKSRLAAEVADRLDDGAGLVVRISGVTRVDLILEEVRRRLLERCLRTALDDGHPFRQVAAALTDAAPPWEQRLALLAHVVLPELPLLLVLDGADALLEVDGTDAGRLGDDQLAAFLATWAATDGTRLIVTTRRPLPLVGRADERLPHHHLGPLSEADTRELIRRLPALDALDPAQLRRAVAVAGGRPRCLELLDALLSGGARLDDVAERRAAVPADRGIGEVDTWPSGVGGERVATTALATDEVLLDALLAHLDPAVRRLLLGAAVHRSPVPDAALQWQVAEQLVGDTAQAHQPPLAVPGGYARARDGLLRLGLLTTVDADTYLVPRWAAAALAARVPSTGAHRRAAQFRRWWVGVEPREHPVAAAALVEARHHDIEGDDVPAAVDVTYAVLEHLHAWGAWAWAEQIGAATLLLVPDDTDDHAVFLHHLGQIALRRGDHAAADRRFRAALSAFDRLGNPVGRANALHDLGVVAQEQGDDDQAEQHHHAALALREDVGDRVGTAASRHQLGVVAESRGRYADAEREYHSALAVEEQLGNRAGIAANHQQLGCVALKRGDHGNADQHCRDALAIHEEIGDAVAIADGHHLLGTIAQARHHLDDAERRHRASLDIRMELGDRPGIAESCGRLGELLTTAGRTADGASYTLTALSLHAELGSPEVDVDLWWLGRQRTAVGDANFRRILAEHLEPEAADHVLGALPDVDEP